MSPPYFFQSCPMMFLSRVLRTHRWSICAAVSLCGVAAVHAMTEGGTDVPVHNYAATFFWIAVLLLAARFASLVEKFGQPSVLGELVIGVVLGNLALLGIPLFT